jgi:aspartate kinase
MKFGGTSVAEAEGRAAIVERVREEIADGYRPVLVVSAMGRKGAPYATDTLLGLVEGGDCAAHELDILMSVGETISAVVMQAALAAAGIAARALTGADAGIFTSADDAVAYITRIDTAYLHELLDEGVVPVVAGFQGMCDDGFIHTLGRGGSDTTACALGVALKACSVDIYTDVDGVFTADPRSVREAGPIERITADELFQMARSGSKVVHAPAAELALQSGVNMRVRNTFSDAPGTQVVSIRSFKPSAVATAVSTVGGMARVRVRLPYAKDDAAAHMRGQTEVYALMADAGISIDMFTPMNDRLVFSVDAGDAARAAALLGEAGFDEVALHEGLAKVTLVGAGMHGVPGVMATVAAGLRDAGIDILQVSDSHATISVLVGEEDMDNAARALHRAFSL